MVDIKKYLEIDLYGLLCVDCRASEGEIRKAYRKKALEFHPDKNPDNPKAEEQFHELSKALEILLDVSARSAYDKVLNAKKSAQLRNQHLDSKRKKLKADLEAREKAATNVSKVTGVSLHYKINKSDEEILQNEIERLRKEGSKLLEEEHELMRQQLLKEKHKIGKVYDSSQHRIKIKWKTNKMNASFYNEENLRFFLKKYGEIIALVISPKKNNSALVEYKTKEAGEMAIAYEKGYLENPLQLEWIGVAPQVDRGQYSSSIRPENNESLIIRQKRQAEERKKLLEDMLKNDNS